ncbi:MAG: HD domain-containing protein [Proteobacteria bacterium]|nr:HD domain-containing protein [Pseudomonadota bacterium]
MKQHSESGYGILKDIDFIWPVAQMVLQHHERIDGSGYPLALKGEKILIEARIIAVADVVDAMASHRPYRPGLGIDAALNEIEKNSGIFYDSTAADACLRLFREKGFNLEGLDYNRLETSPQFDAVCHLFVGGVVSQEILFPCPRGQRVLVERWILGLG